MGTVGLLTWEVFECHPVIGGGSVVVSSFSGLSWFYGCSFDASSFGEFSSCRLGCVPSGYSEWSASSSFCCSCGIMLGRRMVEE